MPLYLSGIFGPAEPFSGLQQKVWKNTLGLTFPASGIFPDRFCRTRGCCRAGFHPNFTEGCFQLGNRQETVYRVHPSRPNSTFIQGNHEVNGKSPFSNRKPQSFHNLPVVRGERNPQLKRADAGDHHQDDFQTEEYVDRISPGCFWSLPGQCLRDGNDSSVNNLRRTNPLRKPQCRKFLSFG